MTEAQTMLELADALRAYAEKYQRGDEPWANALPTLSWKQLELIVTALRATAAAQPVAWKTNTGAATTDKRMAEIWRDTYGFTIEPLYASPTPTPAGDTGEWRRPVERRLSELLDASRAGTGYIEARKGLLDTIASFVRAIPADTQAMREALTAAEPYLETLHSTIPLGPSRNAVLRIIRQVRAALAATGHRAGVCQKCGCETHGEEAWVDGQIWCHPCADGVAVSRPNRGGAGA